MIRLLQARHPNGDASHLAALAEIWGEVVARIIDAMLRRAHQDVRIMNRDTRAQLTLELAQLMLHLEQIVFDDMVRDRRIENIDIGEERRRLGELAERRKIENTGSMYYEQVWKPIVARAHVKHPLVRSAAPPRARKRVIGARSSGPGTKNQHFSPKFSNRLWSSGPDNHVRIYRLDVGLELEPDDKGYRTWGRQDFIYSQALETHLGLIEGDAQATYEKLLALIPINEAETQRWIAFLAAQHLRTPGYVARLLRAVKRHPSLHTAYKKPELVRRRYEQMFVASEVFAIYHRLIANHEWVLLRAPADGQFVRADEPVVIGRAASPWNLVYSMSPEGCFVVGQPRVQTPNFADVRLIDHAELDRVNFMLASNARRSVIARPDAADEHIRVVVRAGLIAGTRSHAQGTFDMQTFAGLGDRI